MPILFPNPQVPCPTLDHFRFALLEALAIFPRPLADGVKVAQVTLTHLVKVRILVGQLPSEKRREERRNESGVVSYGVVMW